MDDSDPRKKMYGDYITQKTTSSSKAKKDEVKPSTKSDYEATAIYLGSTQYGEIASEIAPIVTDRAKEIQKTQGIDYIDARNQALMELVQSGAITEGNLYGYNFNPSALSIATLFWSFVEILFVFNSLIMPSSHFLFLL